MSNCANCGSVILFGGVRHGSMVFCGEGCYNKAEGIRQVLDIPDEDIRHLVREIHEGACPVCGGSGPVDVHSSYRVMSFLVFTRFESLPRISCRECASRARVRNGFLTFFTGWWGFPWGILMTPIYLFYNLTGSGSPPSDEPSRNLIDHTKILVAQHIASQAEEDAGVS